MVSRQTGELAARTPACASGLWCGACAPAPRGGAQNPHGRPTRGQHGWRVPARMQVGRSAAKATEDTPPSSLAACKSPCHRQCEAKVSDAGLGPGRRGLAASDTPGGAWTSATGETPERAARCFLIGDTFHLKEKLKSYEIHVLSYRKYRVRIWFQMRIG